MPIELYWDNDEQTVMLCEFPKKWSWNEMYAMLEKVKQVTDRADREIAAILDLRQGVSIPGGLFSPSTFDHAKKMLKMGEGGSGDVVVVGAGAIIRTIYNAVRNIDPNAVSSVHFADSLEQARAILRERHHVYAPTPV